MHTATESVRLQVPTGLVAFKENSMKKLVTIAVITLLLSLPLYAKDASHPPISVQLWSVKEQLKADFDGTLTALANMGFDGVEFAGDFGSYAGNPSQLKMKLASLGLVASSAHIGFDSLSPQNISQTLLFYKTLGVNLLFVPWDERAWSAQGVNELIKDLNQLNSIAMKYDMRIGFHNHDQEFNAYNGGTYWDHIASNTAASVPLQLDIGWVHYSGKSAVEYINKYPGRTLSSHLKVRTHGEGKLTATFGSNNFDWARIIKTLITKGQNQWLVLEQEEYPLGLTPLESVAKSKQNLDKILAAL